MLKFLLSIINLVIFKKKKIILIDMDETLNVLQEKWIEVYNERYNDSLTRDQWVSWDIHTIIKPECGIKIYDMLREPGFFRHLKINGTAQYVTEWLSQYYNIYVPTSYSDIPETCLDKVEWIRENFPHISPKNIIFINDKWLLRADIMIDDGPHNIQTFKGQKLLIDAPYNKHINQRIPRFNSWDEIYFWFLRNESWYIKLCQYLIKNDRIK